MKTKIKEVISILSNLTNENMGDEEINKIAKGQALLEELEQDFDKKSEEITQLKKDKIGFVKKLGAYSIDNNNNDEKSLDEIIEEVSQNFIKENKK